MSPEGFEPTIPASERPQTDAATGIGMNGVRFSFFGVGRVASPRRYTVAVVGTSPALHFSHLVLKYSKWG